ncbi:MAG: cytochrome c [Winogradskyella sp.]|nr:cytochrome c [Winogradskyella sp.]NNL83245.1 cytochrome c [Winogradskyella sp.]
MKLRPLIPLIGLVLIACNSNGKTTTVTSINTDKTLYNSQNEGQLIYEDFCVTCHLPNGEGVPKAFPPLANSDFLRNNQEASIRGIKYGMSGKIVVNGITYNTAMAPMGLTDKEVADVMNYINNAWGNTIDNVVTESDVSKITK